MAMEDSPEGLPQGWTLKCDVFKSGCEVKYYMNSRTGQKFYSKDDLIRYVKAQNPQLDESQPMESAVERPSNNNQMHYGNDYPEWLPNGWIMELKPGKYGRVYKYYVDPCTGCKFYSKPEVYRYIKNVKQKDSTSKQKEMPKRLDPAEWLPHGWNVQLKTIKSGSASGKVYKFYVDPSTGRKFFSKPEVFRYLKSVKQKVSTSKRKEMLMSMATTEKSTVEDLPPGWIKEFKIRKKTACGIKKDPLYIDPESGYVFRSKKDVQRYLETGDINSCAIIPKKRNIEEKIQPSSASKRQKLEHPVTRHQLIGGDRSSDADSMASPRVYSLRKRTKTILALTNTTEISSQRSPRNDDAEFKQKSNDNCSALPKAEDLERNQDKNVSADGEPGQEQNPGRRIKNEGRCQPRNSLSKSKHQKWLNLPHRRSKRLAGYEPDMAMNSLSIMPLNSEVDKKQGKDSGSGNGAVGSCAMKIQNRLTKSKEALIPLRFSKRLAGVEPDQLANSVSIVQALPKNVRPPHGEMTLIVDLNKGILTQPEPRKELLLHSYSDTDSPFLGDPSNESHGCDTTSPMLTIVEALGRSQVRMINAKSLPLLTPEADMEQEKNCLESEKKQKSQVRNQNNLRASWKKKEFNLPRRSSKRLACIETEMKPNSFSIPHGLANEVAGKTSKPFSEIDSSCHEEANVEGGELPYDPPRAREKKTRFSVEQLKILEKNFELGNNPAPEKRMQLARALRLQPRQVGVWFQNRRAKLKKEQLEKDNDLLKRQLGAIQAQTQKLHAEVERGLETPSPLHGKLSNKNQPFVDGHADFKDKLQTVELSKSPDKRSESEFIPPLGEILSDPCLEFAFKTLTGEFPVEAASVNGPASTPAADIIDERNLTTKKMGRSIKGKAPISSRKSKTTRKLSLSDNALEFQPEPVASPIITSYVFKHAGRLSDKTGAVLGRGSVPYSSAVEQAHHTSVNVKTMHQNESSINTRQYLDNHITSDGLLQVQQISDKPEQRPFVSFDSWSDPCFDSPFKSLAGSTSLEDNIPVNSYFQQQVEHSQIQREGYLQQQSEISQSPRDFSSTLPDFGLPSLFQTDVSVHFDSPEKQLSSQPPMPVNNHSFLFAGSLSFSSCSSIGSQPPPPLVKINHTPPHMKKNRGRPRKVNS